MNAPIPLDDAQTRLLALAEPLAIETVPISGAVARYLASPLTAQRTQPPADISAMDGYAISDPAPWRLIGKSKCGAPFLATVAPGEAVRISTGALLPHGTDRILIQENADASGEIVRLQSRMPSAGTHVRRKGFDFAAGDILLKAGSPINAAQIALILAAGQNTVDVRRKPTVTLIDTGDELVADPEKCLTDQTPASNGAMLAALASELPCKINYIGPVPDSMDALVGALRQCTTSDLIVTSGGASVGDHDFVRPALEEWGATIEFWRIAIKPGKPLLVARRGEQLVLGLPGNPVSSFATGFLFMLPLLRHLSGSRSPLPRRSIGRAGIDLPSTGPRREFLRAVEVSGTVTPINEQDSSALRALSSANCLIERPENSGEMKAGTDVPIYLIRNG